MKNRTTYTLEERPERYGGQTYYAIPANGTEPRYLARSLEDARKGLEEYNTRYRLSDYADDEIKEFYDSFPLDFLNEAVSRQLGVPVTFQKEELREKDWHAGLFTTINLARHSLLIAAAWSEFKVDTFSAGVGCNPETGELYFWSDIHYSYRHHSGGTNGARIGNFMYSHSKGPLYTLARREGKAAAKAIIEQYLWNTFSDPLIFADRHHLAEALFESDAMHIDNPNFTFALALDMIDALAADGWLVLASKETIGDGREDIIADSPVYKMK